MRQNFLRSVKGIAKRDKKLLQSVICMKKCKYYYKVRRKKVNKK